MIVYAFAFREGGIWATGPKAGEDYSAGTLASLHGRVIVAETRKEAEDFHMPGCDVVELDQAPPDAFPFQEWRTGKRGNLPT
jgi:hypothetical protein